MVLRCVASRWSLQPDATATRRRPRTNTTSPDVSAPTALRAARTVAGGRREQPHDLLHARPVGHVLSSSPSGPTTVVPSRWLLGPSVLKVLPSGLPVVRRPSKPACDSWPVMPVKSGKCAAMRVIWVRERNSMRRNNKPDVVLVACEYIACSSARFRPARERARQTASFHATAPHLGG